ncbi:hypothetical protein K502DRAFT_367024 [Neoconidiobolus thromboides FSU 785]|nr:hypothetical protein K502DRAFT_367024 [Neoconidiobolus thromboides FSU 785]
MTKRFALSISQKLEVIKLHEDGMLHKDIAKHFNVGRSTVTKILLKKDEITQLSKGIQIDLREKVRKHKFANIEQKVMEWCSYDLIKSHKGDLLFPLNYNSDKIKEKAKEIAAGIGENNFIADNKWLARFRRRFKLNFVIKRRCKAQKFIGKANGIESEHLGYCGSLPNLKSSLLDDWNYILDNEILLNSLNSKFSNNVNNDSVRAFYNKDHNKNYKPDNTILNINSSNFISSGSNCIPCPYQSYTPIATNSINGLLLNGMPFYTDIYPSIINNVIPCQNTSFYKVSIFGNSSFDHNIIQTQMKLMENSIV